MENNVMVFYQQIVSAGINAAFPGVHKHMTVVEGENAIKAQMSYIKSLYNFNEKTGIWEHKKNKNISITKIIFRKKKEK